MAASRSKPQAETPEGNAAANQPAETAEEFEARVANAKAEVDVVAVPSIDKNGDPDQTPDYKQYGVDVEIEHP